MNKESARTAFLSKTPVVCGCIMKLLNDCAAHEKVIWDVLSIVVTVFNF